jgi:hypothetical protein
LTTSLKSVTQHNDAEETDPLESGLRLLAKLIAAAIRREQQAEAASELPPPDAAAA